MAAIIEDVDATTFDRRLDAIMVVLKSNSIEGTAVVRHEMNNDIFIKNFLARNSASIPDTSFIMNRLRKVPPPQD